jgi:hypothetical protein
MKANIALVEIISWVQYEPPCNAKGCGLYSCKEVRDIQDHTGLQPHKLSQFFLTHQKVPSYPII